MMLYSKFQPLPSPSYVFSVDELKTHVRRVRAAFSGMRILYAMKANPFLTGALKDEVNGFEVCSPGEERICESAGIPGEKLVLSGVNKEKADFTRIISRYKAQPTYTAESMQQAAMLEEIASERGLTLRVLIRVTSGNQFGMDADTVIRLIRSRSRYPHLSFAGLQYFSGTQKKLDATLSEIDWMDALFKKLSFEYGYEAEEFEFGPGLYVPYFEGEADKRIESMLHIRDRLKAMRFSGRISLEMGRFLAADCGYYLTRIADIKTNDGTTYCIVDGGIHQVNYYGQMMAMKVPHILKKSGGQEQECMICGSLCTTADVLVRKVKLPDPQVGDLLVFTGTGAYSVTEGISLFLSRDLPRVFLREGDRMTEVRERIETARWNHGTTD